MLNPKTIVKLSNSIGLIAILLLLFWVFGFIVTEIFDLQLISFRKEFFGISILALLSLMAGALILNIMFNLSRIASRGEPQSEDSPQKVKRLKWILLSGFPIVAIALFAGDNYYKETASKKSLEFAKHLQTQLAEEVELEAYEFNKNWIGKSEKTLSFINQLNGRPGNLSLIWQDTLNGKKHFFSISEYYENEEDSSAFEKETFLLLPNKEESEQFEKLLNGEQKTIQLERSGRNFESFIPFTQNKKTFILQFNEYQ
ncbi:MAG: hypothetical protein LCH37_13455 [Bacteroidetes bacterium]|nr:hypothetical protein [Bacteroidota bacterium]